VFGLVEPMRVVPLNLKSIDAVQLSSIMFLSVSFSVYKDSVYVRGLVCRFKKNTCVGIILCDTPDFFVSLQIMEYNNGSGRELSNSSNIYSTPSISNCKSFRLLRA
jgi:hypothetical protein